ncbi:MAG: YceI family protein [Rhodothalassiaceae bacterium]
MRSLIHILAISALLAGPGLTATAQQLTQDPAQVSAATYTIDPAHTRVIFSVNHLGFSTYQGTFPNAEGSLALDPDDLSETALDVTIDVAGVSTADPELDKHLRAEEFFDADTYPTARFVSTKVERTGDNTARITGDLTMKGVTRPVTLDATFNQAGVNPVNERYTVGFDASGVIKRSDFGVSAYVPFVGDEVMISIGSEFTLPE